MRRVGWFCTGFWHAQSLVYPTGRNPTQWLQGSAEVRELIYHGLSISQVNVNSKHPKHCESNVEAHYHVGKSRLLQLLQTYHSKLHRRLPFVKKNGPKSPSRHESSFTFELWLKTYMIQHFQRYTLVSNTEHVTDVCSGTGTSGTHCKYMHRNCYTLIFEWHRNFPPNGRKLRFPISPVIKFIYLLFHQITTWRKKI